MSIKIRSAIPENPQWIPVQDYGIPVPETYISLIEEECEKFNRLPLLASMWFTRYGEVDDVTSLDGVIYQYVMSGNPRHVKYAFVLMEGGQIVAKNSELQSVYVAQNLCTKSALKR